MKNIFLLLYNEMTQKSTDICYLTCKDAQSPTDAWRNMNGIRVLMKVNFVLLMLSDFFDVGSSRLVTSLQLSIFLAFLGQITNNECK